MYRHPPKSLADEPDIEPQLRAILVNARRLIRREVERSGAPAEIAEMIAELVRDEYLRWPKEQFLDSLAAHSALLPIVLKAFDVFQGLERLLPVEILPLWKTYRAQLAPVWNIGLEYLARTRAAEKVPAHENIQWSERMIDELLSMMRTDVLRDAELDLARRSVMGAEAEDYVSDRLLRIREELVERQRAGIREKISNLSGYIRTSIVNLQRDHLRKEKRHEAFELRQKSRPEISVEPFFRLSEEWLSFQQILDRHLEPNEREFLLRCASGYSAREAQEDLNWPGPVPLGHSRSTLQISEANRVRMRLLQRVRDYWNDDRRLGEPTATDSKKRST